MCIPTLMSPAISRRSYVLLWLSAGALIAQWREFFQSGLERSLPAPLDAEQGGTDGLRQLVADRQCADALAGGVEDGVGEGRRDRRHAGFADAAERQAVVAGRHEVDVDLLRRGVDARDLEAVEVGLLRAPVLERDLAQGREADAHHHRALHLRTDAVWVDLRPAIDRDV